MGKYLIPGGLVLCLVVVFGFVMWMAVVYDNSQTSACDWDDGMQYEIKVGKAHWSARKYGVMYCYRYEIKGNVWTLYDCEGNVLGTVQVSDGYVVKSSRLKVKIDGAID